MLAASFSCSFQERPLAKRVAQPLENIVRHHVELALSGLHLLFRGGL